MTTLTAQKIDN